MKQRNQIVTSNRVPLHELLSQQDIVHPTQYKNWSMDGRLGILEIEGYAWWDPRVTHNGSSLSIEFNEITNMEFCLDALENEYWNKYFEDFTFRRLRDSISYSKEISEIYCNSPLTNPIKLILSIENFLLDESLPNSAYHLSIRLR